MIHFFSIIVPVYNRPQEIKELLESIVQQDFVKSFEIIIVEDGSNVSCEKIVNTFQSTLNIRYFFKENSGAGASRNFGMENAKGNYFLVLDSDVILPPNYLTSVDDALEHHFTDAFGGPDEAHSNFSRLQKAINYSMTSFLTTGGIRGRKNSLGKFQPRSFNFGISKEAFIATKGFSSLKNGEDIDLTFRLWKLNFKTQLISPAFVYHKRRSSIKQFFKQTFGFGTARPFLNKKYPKTAKITYWFPSIFVVGLGFGMFAAMLGFCQILYCYGAYFGILFLDVILKTKNILVALLSTITTLVQFFGYGLGFLVAILFPKIKR